MNRELMSMRDFIGILWKNKLLIIVVSLLLGILSLIFTMFFITPVYESESSVMVTSGSSSREITVNDLNVSNKLVKTYKELIVSDRVLQNVIDKLNLGTTTVSQLKSKLTVTVTTDTEIIYVKARDNDPNVAKNIANTVVSEFKDQIPKIYANSGNDRTAVAVDEAKAPTSPVSPKLPLNIIAGMILGLLIASGYSIASEMLKNTVYSPEDIKKQLGVTVIGIVQQSDEIVNGGADIEKK